MNVHAYPMDDSSVRFHVSVEGMLSALSASLVTDKHCFLI